MSCHRREEVMRVDIDHEEEQERGDPGGTRELRRDHTREPLDEAEFRETGRE